MISGTNSDDEYEVIDDEVAGEYSYGTNNDHDDDHDDQSHDHANPDDDAYYKTLHSQRPGWRAVAATAVPALAGAADAHDVTDQEVLSPTVSYDVAETHTDDKTGTIVSAVYAVTSNLILHLVGGKEYFGLLLDPGASRGILGTDTLHAIITYILEPHAMAHYIVWSPSSASFSGIAASVQRSIAAVTLPIGLMGLPNSIFKADVLGGDASQCPGLMPLKSLIAAGAISAFGCFSNGDGLIAFQDAQTQRMCPQRLYITDSGHYLLPIDQFDSPIDERLVDFMIKNFTYRLARPPSGSNGQWRASQKGRSKGAPRRSVKSDDSWRHDRKDEGRPADSSNVFAVFAHDSDGNYMTEVNHDSPAPAAYANETAYANEIMEKVFR